MTAHEREGGSAVLDRKVKQWQVNAVRPRTLLMNNKDVKLVLLD